MSLEEAAKFLDDFAESLRVSLRRVGEERLQRVLKHLALFVDKETLYVVRTHDQLLAVEYAAMMLRLQASAKAPRTFVHDDDPTSPGFTPPGPTTPGEPGA